MVLFEFSLFLLINNSEYCLRSWKLDLKNQEVCKNSFESLPTINGFITIVCGDETLTIYLFLRLRLFYDIIYLFIYFKHIQQEVRDVKAPPVGQQLSPPCLTAHGFSMDFTS